MAEVTIDSSTPQNSEPILGKFKSQDDLVSAYQALEKKLSEKGMTMEVEGEAQVAPPVDTTPSETPATLYGEGITSALAASGLSTDTVAAEYESESGLSADTRAKLNAAFGETVVNNYFAGLDAAKSTALQETSAAEQEVLTLFGGVENWGTVSQWAVSESLELSEAFNDALDSGNARYMKTAAMALKGAYESSKGTLSSQSVLKGQVPASSASVGYSSKAEMLQDIASGKYQNDPAFRDQVAKRIGASEGFTYS